LREIREIDVVELIAARKPGVSGTSGTTSPGTISSVAAVNNRFQHLDERKAALYAWGRFVESLVRPEDAERNVVALAAR
jgi:hypothetical protein